MKQLLLVTSRCILMQEPTVLMHACSLCKRSIVGSCSILCAGLYHRDLVTNARTLRALNFFLNTSSRLYTCLGNHIGPKAASGLHAQCHHAARLLQLQLHVPGPSALLTACMHSTPWSCRISLQICTKPYAHAVLYSRGGYMRCRMQWHQANM